MNRLFGLLAGEVVNYISHRSETNYLVDKLGCKKTTQELCAQLRVYQNDVAPAPRLEDLIRYHFKACDPSCEYYVPLDQAMPSLCHGIIEYGTLLTCRRLYAVVLYHTLHNRYPDEAEHLLFLQVMQQRRFPEFTRFSEFGRFPYEFSEDLLHNHGFPSSNQIRDFINAEFQPMRNNLQDFLNELPLYNEPEPFPKKNIDLPTHVLKSDIKQTCCICQEDMLSGDKVMTLPCLHMFHTHMDKCMGIEKWFEKSYECPLCKHKIE